MVEHVQKVAHDISALLKAIGGIDRRRYTTAIVVAAGQSTRMTTSLSKQFLPVDGMPVIARTLLTLERAKEIREIVLVCFAADYLFMVIRHSMAWYIFAV